LPRNGDLLFHRLPPRRLVASQQRIELRQFLGAGQRRDMPCDEEAGPLLFPKPGYAGPDALFDLPGSQMPEGLRVEPRLDVGGKAPGPGV
jgi:hypothetical protein